MFYIGFIILSCLDVVCVTYIIKQGSPCDTKESALYLQ